MANGFEDAEISPLNNIGGTTCLEHVRIIVRLGVVVSQGNDSDFIMGRHTANVIEYYIVRAGGDEFGRDD